VSLKTPSPPLPTPDGKQGVKEIEITGPITVGDLAARLRISPAQVQQDLMKLGILANLNQTVSVENAVKVAQGRGVPVRAQDGRPQPRMATPAAPAAPKKPRAGQPVARPPVVVIMGHVDHGKTTLLDTIRKTNVTDSEFGGITQHIGAYQVEVESSPGPDGKPTSKRITFLDTPGHEAFTAMRARGARVTDIAVLVVAADDGIMPQTIEALSHAKAAGVPIIVAVNKVDLENANPQRVLTQLMEHDIVPEDFGGKTTTVQLSAKTGEGVRDLLDYILLEAELAELTADPTADASGTIIEAKLDPGKGPVATVLVESGTLFVGDAVVAGTTYGKIKAMMDDRGRRLNRAGPAMPVEVLGLARVPMAGDRLEVVESERVARTLGAERDDMARAERFQGARGARVSLEDLYRQIREGEIKDLNLVVKADVQGSVEAVRQALERLENPEVRVNVIHAGVGNVGESDILLASAAGAIVIGFNVKVDPQAQRAAQDEGVDIRTYRIIYDLLEEVQLAMDGLLTPIFQEVSLGKATVRAVFKLPRGLVAGCYVNEGLVRRGADVRLIRGREVIHTGKIDSLKHLKDDVREMAAGYECGIMMDGFNNYQEGDVFEAFQMEQVVRRGKPTASR
jgi:translation initiation factor IF-2